MIEIIASVSFLTLLSIIGIIVIITVKTRNGANADRNSKNSTQTECEDIDSDEPVVVARNHDYNHTPLATIVINYDSTSSDSDEPIEELYGLSSIDNEEYDKDQIYMSPMTKKLISEVVSQSHNQQTY